jgi:hypothetical protein
VCSSINLKIEYSESVNTAVIENSVPETFLAQDDTTVSPDKVVVALCNLSFLRFGGSPLGFKLIEYALWLSPLAVVGKI